MSKLNWITSVAVISIATLLALAPAQAAEETIASTNIQKAQTRSPMETNLLTLQQEWAKINYSDMDKASKVENLAILAIQADGLVDAYPKAAEPLIWLAIIKATEAGAKGGTGALHLVKQAKAHLEKAEQIDATALDGSVYTSLGSMYYQVPGKPISFGSKKKANLYLTKALEINPDGIDPNYFYGDYLLKRKKYNQAITVLEHALEAPDRPGRALADSGRRAEIKAALKLANAKKK